MSIDGFVAGPDQSVENPLGIGGMRLHEWVFPLRAWRAMHGERHAPEVHQDLTKPSSLLDAVMKMVKLDVKTLTDAYEGAGAAVKR